jgi:hypothetical protein
MEVSSSILPLLAAIDPLSPAIFAMASFFQAEQQHAAKNLYP